jgi:predicted TPR repeat methyltransferase
MSKFFERAYGTTKQDDIVDLYEDWAQSYDDDLRVNGYATPGRCAAALAGHLTPFDAPIFDFACGTGLSGAALAALGFTVIDGVDLSDAMLARALGRGVYRTLSRAEPEAAPALEPGAYGAISAMGALSPGAAPARYFDLLLDGLAPGGLMVFSYNDHTLVEPEYTSRVDQALADGRARELFREHGPHIEKLGSQSTVYVFEKL